MLGTHLSVIAATAGKNAQAFGAESVGRLAAGLAVLSILVFAAPAQAQVTPDVYGFASFNTESRLHPTNASISGKMTVWVNYPLGGVAPAGVGTDDLTVTCGSGCAATVRSARTISGNSNYNAIYTVDIAPTTSGQSITIMVNEDTITGGNDPHTYFGSPTTATAFTVTMATTASEPVSGDFDVNLTFSEAVSFEQDEQLLNGMWPVELSRIKAIIEIDNGSILSASRTDLLFPALRTLRIRPKANFEGTLTITIPEGKFAPLSSGPTGTRSNNRRVFRIEVDTLTSADAALETLEVRDSVGTVPLSPSFSPGVGAYQAQVARSVTRVTVDATVRHRQATGPVFLDGSDMMLTDADGTTDGHQVDLAVGENTVKVKVTAEDGTTSETYTLAILRNARPMGSDGTVTIAEGAAHTFGETDFGFADTDSGDTLSSVKVVTLPGKGTLTLDGSSVSAGDSVPRQQIVDGDLVFTPATGGSGEPYTTFTFKVSDGTSESVSAHTITVNVTPNVAPSTAASAVSTAPDVDHMFSAADFRFTDTTGETLAGVRVVTLSGKGTLKLDNTNVMAGDVILRDRLDAGDFTFSPVAGEEGSPYTTFRFKVSDGKAESPAAEMTIHVTNNNIAPTVRDGTVRTIPDTAYVFTEPDLNYQDPEGNALSYMKVVTLPGKGTLKLDNADVMAGDMILRNRLDAGDFTFSPVAGEEGSPYTVFRFKASDGIEESAEATMTINVTVDNVAPTAGNVTIRVSPGEEHTFGEGDFNFSDGDGDTLKSIRVVTLPALGVLVLEAGEIRNHLVADQVVTSADIAGGNFVYTAAEDGGSTSFTFRVSDGMVESDGEATMTIRIRNVTVDNVAPTAGNVTIRVSPGEEHTFGEGDFNFSDGDGDTLKSIRVVTLPALGVLVLEAGEIRNHLVADQVVTSADIAGGNFVYTAAEDGGSTSFTFRVSDGTVESDGVATMTIRIREELPQAPGRPALSRAAGDDGALEVRWDEPDNTHCDGVCPEITHYDLSYRRSAGENGRSWEGWIDRSRVGAAAGTVAVIPLSDVRRHYQARVRAVNAKGAVGAWSEPGEWAPPRMSVGRVLKAWLSRFGRVVAGQVMNAAGDRLYAPSGDPPGIRSGIAGLVFSSSSEPSGTAVPVDSVSSESRISQQDESAFHERVPGEDGKVHSRGLSGRDLIGSAFFSYSDLADGLGAVSVWGRGAISDFSGRDRYADETVAVDGQADSLMVGADITRSDSTLGLLLAHSRSRGEYEYLTDTEGDGRLRSTLTGLYPYGKRDLQSLSVWAMAGYGKGDVTLHRDQERVSSSTADLSLLLAAGGVRGHLSAFSPGGLSLDMVADAMGVRLESEGVEGILSEAKAELTRLRVGMEGAWPGIDANGGWITPVGRIGVRHDGGDAERGFGAEFEAGLHWSAPGRGIETRIEVHGLLTHESEGFEESGVSGTLLWDPKPGSHRGAAFSLSGSANGSATEYMDSLMNGSGGGRLSGLTEQGAFGGGDGVERMEAKLGYGVGVFGGSYTGIPELGVSWGEWGRDWSAGWRLVRSDRDSFEALLKATHGKSADDGESRRKIGLWLRESW